MHPVISGFTIPDHARLARFTTAISSHEESRTDHIVFSTSASSPEAGPTYAYYGITAPVRWSKGHFRSGDIWKYLVDSVERVPSLRTLGKQKTILGRLEDMKAEYRAE
ncbi:hypothetical protein LTR33_017436, partial [Friedmanniomyces endolithicus]